MITTIFSLIFILLMGNMKEFFLVSMESQMNFFYCTLMYIMPLTFYILISTSFTYSKLMMKKMYVANMSVMVILLMINFLVSSPYLFILFMELSVLPMIYSILNLSKDEDKLSSMMFMFSLNILGSIPFLIYYFNLKEIYILTNNMILESFVTNFDSSSLMIAYLILLLSKFPVLFLHFWLNKAHVSASGSISMILASLMLKMGTFGLMKFSKNFELNLMKNINLMMVVTVATTFFISMIMIRLFDIKYMIACSSVVHMSLILPAVASLSSNGAILSIYMMAGHGLTSCMLFLMVTIIYESTMGRSIKVTKSMESVDKSMIMFTLMWIFMNLGLPPFINFYTEMMFLIFFKNMSNILWILFMVIMVIFITYTMILITLLNYSKKLMTNKYMMNLKLMMTNFYMMVTTMSILLIN